MLAQNYTSFKGWNFDKIRGYLLMKTAGYNSVIYLLRERHGVLSMDPFERNSILVNQAMLAGLKKEETDIDRVTAALGLPPLFVEKSVAWEDLNEKEIEDLCLPVYPVGLAPFPTGFYIKVSPATPLNTVIASYKSIQAEMNRSYRDEKQRPIKVARRDTMSRDLEAKILCYTVIEVYIYRQDSPEKKTFLSEDIVTNAIVSAREDARLKQIVLSKGDDDVAYLTNAYRDIQRKYKIPPYTDFVKLHIKPLLNPTQ